MRTVWVVRWRGIEEECSCREDAIDRWDKLDAHGIEAKVFEVFAGERRRMWLYPASWMMQARCSGSRLSAGGLANRARFRLTLDETEDAFGLAMNATGLTFAATDSRSTIMGVR